MEWKEQNSIKVMNMAGQGKFNDVGKVKLNISDVELEVNWNVKPHTIKSIELKAEIIPKLIAQFGSDEATIYLDVTKPRGKGYAEQRFKCGTSLELEKLKPECLEGNGNNLKINFSPSCKFVVTIVNTSSEKRIFRRTPSLQTTEGDNVDMFWLDEVSELGEIPFEIIPPMRNESEKCTIQISSICFNIVNKKRDHGLLKNMLFLSAFRTSISHIADECHTSKNVNTLEDDSFSPWINWIKDTLKIDPPSEYDENDVNEWKTKSVAQFSQKYSLATRFNAGLKEVWGDE